MSAAFFLAGLKCALKTEWRIFLRAWDDFISFENEFSLLMRKQQKQEKLALLFGPDYSFEVMTAPEEKV